MNITKFYYFKDKLQSEFIRMVESTQDKPLIFDKSYEKILAQSKKSIEADRAYGSVFAAFIGDSAGGVLEFIRHTITQVEVD